MNDRRRGIALKQMTEAALYIGRQYGLDTIELLDTVAKTMAALTEAAMTMKPIQRSVANLMTPLASAKLSPLHVGVGKPDESEPYTYYFCERTKRYFSGLDSQIVEIKSSNVPFCTWSAADIDDAAADYIRRKAEDADRPDGGAPDTPAGQTESA